MIIPTRYYTGKILCQGAAGWRGMSNSLQRHSTPHGHPYARRHAHPHTLTYEHAYAAIRMPPRRHARNDRMYARTHALPSARPPARPVPPTPLPVTHSRGGGEGKWSGGVGPQWESRWTYRRARSWVGRERW